MHNEKDIVKKLQTRDRSVMNDIYDMYADTFYGLCLKISNNNTQIAEDTLQEGFIKIWRYGKSYDPKKGRLYTWMLNIMRNTAIDKLRKTKRKDKIQMDVGDVHTLEDALSSSMNEGTLDIRDKVGNLDEKYREVIDSAYFVGLTQKEIAKKLNIPLGTVKTRIRSAINQLRDVYLRN